MAQPPGADRIQRRFDLLRSQTEQQSAAQKDQLNEGIDRQAAARGRLGSGAMQKVKAQAGQQQDLAKRQALEGVESQRDMALGAAEEVQANRDFAKSEREAGQAFASGEQALQRQFATSERMGSQGFAADQAKKQMGFQQKLANTQNRQWSKQFKEDQRISDFNMKIAQQTLRQNAKEAPGLLGMGGMLGTGLGGEKGVLGTGIGGGGGKIICTEYCRQGWISEEVLKGDLEYAAKHLTLEVRVNYLMWAQYVVPMMQKYPVLLYLFWPITYNWVHYMAWKVGRYPHKPLFGPFIEYTATRISNVIGRSMRAHRREKKAWAYK